MSKAFIRTYIYNILVLEYMCASYTCNGMLLIAKSKGRRSS